MEKELRNLQMEIYIKENFIKENHRVMDNIFGKMGVSIKEILKMVNEKDSEYGKEIKEIVINMRDNMCKIKKMDMVSFLGQAAIFIKVIMLMTKDKAMDKCIGWMEATTKVNGSKGPMRDKVNYS